MQSTHIGRLVGHVTCLFGVRADDEYGCIGGQLVERLEPHLEPSDVPSEQMMRAVVQFKSRQIDDQNVQINVHLSFENINKNTTSGWESDTQCVMRVM